MVAERCSSILPVRTKIVTKKNKSTKNMISYVADELILISNGYLFEYANVESVAADGSPVVRYSDNSTLVGHNKTEHLLVHPIVLHDIGIQQLPNGIRWNSYSPSFFIYDANNVGTQWPRYRHEEVRFQRNVDMFIGGNHQARIAAYNDFRQFLGETIFHQDDCRFYIAEYLVEEYNFTGDKESLLEAKSLYEELLRKNPNHAGYIKHLAEVNQSLKKD
ncbi:hypothetical protein CIK90_02135 [Prevotella sp. P5-126]|nr:hypothetical protein CIK90_02135 [Prevotella sp. P5-126]